MRLPSDLLLYTFKFLEMSDVLRMMQVSKEWKLAGENATCWKQLHKQMNLEQSYKIPFYRLILPYLHTDLYPIKSLLINWHSKYLCVYTLLLIFFIVYSLWVVFSHITLTSVSGVMLSNNITSIEHENTVLYFVNVLYTYSIDGETYNGTTVYRGYDTYYDTDKEDQVIQNIYSIANHPLITVLLDSDGKSFLRDIIPYDSYLCFGVFCLVSSILWVFCFPWSIPYEQDWLITSHKRYIFDLSRWMYSIGTNKPDFVNNHPQLIKQTIRRHLCFFSCHILGLISFGALLLHYFLIYFDWKTPDQINTAMPIFTVAFLLPVSFFLTGFIVWKGNIHKYPDTDWRKACVFASHGTKYFVLNKDYEFYIRIDRMPLSKHFYKPMMVHDAALIFTTEYSCPKCAFGTCDCEQRANKYELRLQSDEPITCMPEYGLRFSVNSLLNFEGLEEELGDNVSICWKMSVYFRYSFESIEKSYDDEIDIQVKQEHI